MAHKLGAFHHLPHGVANALLITILCGITLQMLPRKWALSPSIRNPNALPRYCECARFVGVNGSTDEEVFENFLVKIEELKARVGIKKTIRDYGVTEEAFLATLDDMCEQAFDDQCTGANPRYPLISEIKAMYLKAFYGEVPAEAAEA